MKNKDTIFQNQKVEKSSFRFNNAVAGVFDDMLHRSIPFYAKTLKLTTQVILDYSQENTNIFDLGCSNGNTIVNISQKLKKKMQIIGIDSSEAMIDKAKEKISSFKHSQHIQLIHGDCLSEVIQNASAVIMNYTLQFIPQEQRKLLCSNIYNGLNDNGIFIVSEKIIEDNCYSSKINQEFYDAFKLANGYSELEIFNKREALENILVPETPQNHIQRLKNSGFKSVHIIFKCFNFSTFLAVK